MHRILALAVVCTLAATACGCRLLGRRTDEFGYCRCNHSHQHVPAHHGVAHEHTEFLRR